MRPAEPAPLAVGEIVRDVARDRIGVVVRDNGPRVVLRPLGGGPWWQVGPGGVRRVAVSTALRALVAEANARSRRGRGSSPVTP